MDGLFIKNFLIKKHYRQIKIIIFLSLARSRKNYSIILKIIPKKYNN